MEDTKETKVGKYSSFMQDVWKRIMNGSIDPEKVMDAIKPLLREGLLISNFDDHRDPVSFMVPEDHDPDFHFKNFCDKYRHGPSTLRFWEESYIQMFMNPSHELQPGKKYSVQFLRVLRSISSEDCIKFLSEEMSAILVGAKGLAFIQGIHPKEFPGDRCCVSFDKNDRLPKDPKGFHQIPKICRHDSQLSFSGKDFEGHLFPGDVVVCFKEQK